jgi:gamma-polyglutamate biosynthesis protein CapC
VSSEYVLVIGVVVSILMTELVGVSPGGIIVPGYVALYLGAPVRLAATAGDAAAAFLLVHLLGRFTVLFGRRRYVSFLLAGFLTRFLVERFLPLVSPEAPVLVAVGWLIPGIVASDADRQGPLVTLAALTAAVLLVRLTWVALG